MLSPRQDAAALAGSLVRLLTDPALRQRFGDSGHQRLLQRFGQQRMHQRYVRCYEQMLQRVASRPQRAVRALAG